jgi:hypothetical protein
MDNATHIPLVLLLGTVLACAGCGGASRPAVPASAVTTTCTQRTTTNYEGEATTYCGEDYASDFQEGQNAPDAQTVTVPLDVKALPYYDDAWTLTRHGGTIEVQTDMYRDDDGRQFGWTVCIQTWYSYPDDDVMVLAADGGPLAHRFAPEPCKKG